MNKLKRILFIDRDGTLIKEPADEQIDSFEKLVFYPEALQYLPKIAKEFNFQRFISVFFIFKKTLFNINK